MSSRRASLTTRYSLLATGHFYHYRLTMTLSVSMVMALVLAGFLIGVVSGMVGIGGGLMIVPLLTLVFGFTQAKAGATSLAVLLPPVGIFAVLTYHKAGLIDWRIAIVLAIGFVFGALIGAKLVAGDKVPESTLKIIFAALLIYCAGMTLFKSLPIGQRAAISVGFIVVAFPLFMMLAKLLRKQLESSPRWGRLYQMYLESKNPCVKITDS